MRQRGRISAKAADVIPIRVTATPLEPPRDLTPTEAAIFRQTIVSVHADHFKQQDLHLVASYAQAVAASRRLAKEMVRKPFLTEHWATANRIAKELATKLRLCVSSRESSRRAAQRIRAHNPPSAYDTMDLD